MFDRTAILRERTYFLADQAPDGHVEMMRYTQSEMEEVFTAEQRELLAAGERVNHRWSKHDFGHTIVDMGVCALEKLAR
jgi:hypothetical protein